MRVNEIFYSIQGEGVRAGTPAVFVRFSGCNLACRREVEGFDCDTEFVGGREMTREEVLAEIRKATAPLPCQDNVILTGGEPALQITGSLLRFFRDAGYRVAIETNGSIELPPEANEFCWVTVSPKTAEHCLRQKTADEVKYVRAYGQALPRPSVKASHYLISPAFGPGGVLDRQTLDWCVKLCKENPPWRLSVQLHQLLGLR